MRLLLEISVEPMFFCPRVTCGSKLCNLIINSSCTENVVSIELVMKLDLKMEQKSKPYQLSLLND